MATAEVIYQICKRDKAVQKSPPQLPYLSTLRYTILSLFNLFEIQLEHLEVLGSHIAEAWLGEF